MGAPPAACLRWPRACAAAKHWHARVEEAEIAWMTAAVDTAVDADAVDAAPRLGPVAGTGDMRPNCGSQPSPTVASSSEAAGSRIIPTAHCCAVREATLPCRQRRPSRRGRSIATARRDLRLRWRSSRHRHWRWRAPLDATRRGPRRVLGGTGCPMETRGQTVMAAVAAAAAAYERATAPTETTAPHRCRCHCQRLRAELRAWSRRPRGQCVATSVEQRDRVPMQRWSRRRRGRARRQSAARQRPAPRAAADGGRPRRKRPRRARMGVMMPMKLPMTMTATTTTKMKSRQRPPP